MRSLLVALTVLCCTATAGAQQPAVPAPSPAATPIATPTPMPPAVDAIAQQRVVQIFTVPIEPAWFSASFLDRFAPEQVAGVVRQLNAALGDYRSVTRLGTGDYSVQFVKGTDEVLIHLDAANKIDMLFGKPPVVTQH
ncbi:MAG TPA: hypothetical protein VFB22_09020 [Candidatus Baltobacteraceae bacterium]|nr:hypothetical protein [Candidatus Baltobacteraceae bacterium]